VTTSFSRVEADPIAGVNHRPHCLGALSNFPAIGSAESHVENDDIHPWPFGNQEFCRLIRTNEGDRGQQEWQAAS
jgi:hypothetical protein